MILKEVEKLRPLAIIDAGFFTALYIIQIKQDIEDKVQVVYINGDEIKRPTWHKIYTDSLGEFYIKKI